MRKAFEPQMKIGETGIQSIRFDPRSRDEIPKVLRGLQSIDSDNVARNEAIDVIKGIIPPKISLNKGRPGMFFWKILVLGSLRHGCNWDYDHLVEMANKHEDIRKMLMHEDYDKSLYALNTVKDNLKLFTPEVADQLNVIAVKHGHKLIGIRPDEDLFGSCDSYPVQTNVHFPTDINILWDAMRKLVTTIIILCRDLGIVGWRKGLYNLKRVKELFRHAQNVKRSKSKNPNKRAEQGRRIINAHSAYLEFAQSLIDRAKESLKKIPEDDIHAYLKALEIMEYIKHAERQIDQIRRRVVDGESIPHNEKVFSIFEEHTEWIVKGKIGVIAELGLNVCIVKDQYGFLLYHHVMEHETDKDVAVTVIREVQKRFENFTGCSFDKGFHSPENQKELSTILDKLVLPRKGKLSAINKEIENSEEFKKARRKHSAVESAINALENGGLDRCPDHAIDGFKRYAGLSLLARNLHTIGNILQKKEVEREKRRKAQKKRMAA